MKTKNIKIMSMALCAAIVFSGCVAAPAAQTRPEEPKIKEPDKVSFIAAGDNLIHGSIYLQAAKRSGDGEYDFDFAYENVKYYFEDFDVKFINQETLVNSAFAPSTYPQFSSPTQLGDKVLDLGFNVIGTSNNHSYDKGSRGVYSSLEYWNSKDVVNVGFYTGDDEKDIKYLTVNNIKMAFLAYTYGTNGLSIYDENCPYIIHPDDFEQVERQVATAKANADIVIVSCHWGYEDTNTVNDYQKMVAQKLNDMGVDVIIGTHPHVVQPVEWITNPENGNRTLVCYSLGNFISAQSRANNMIGGLFQFNIVKTYDENENFTISVQEPYFIPTITHYDWGVKDIRNYILSDYTPQLAQNHGVKTYDSRFSYEYVQNVVNEVIPEEFLLYTPYRTEDSQSNRS